MKRPIRSLTVTIVAAVGLLASSVVASAGLAGAASAATTGRHFVVGYTDPSGAQAILRTEQEAFTAEAKRLGMQVKVLDANLNTSTQVGNIDQFVAQKVNGIAVLPLAATTLAPALTQAQEAGIKVVGITAIPKKPTAGESIAPYDTIIEHQLLYQSGKKVAGLIAKNIGGKGSVLPIGLSVPVPNVIFQMQQWTKYLKQAAPKATILPEVDNATDTIAGAESVVANAITKYHGKISAIMAYNDTSAIGAARALKAANITGVYIVGADGNPQGIAAVKSGEIDADVEYPPWDTGLIAADEMYRMLTHRSVPKYVLTISPVWTKQNVNQRLDWTTAVSEIASGKLTCSGANRAQCPPGVAP